MNSSSVIKIKQNNLSQTIGFTQILAEYYEYYGTNPHNTDAPLSQQMLAKIKMGRQLLAKLWLFQADEVSFQPSSFFAETIAAQIIKENKNYHCYYFGDHGKQSVLHQQNLAKNQIDVFNLNFINQNYSIDSGLTSSSSKIYVGIELAFNSNLQSGIDFCLVVKTACPNCTIITYSEQLFGLNAIDNNSHPIDCFIFSPHQYQIYGTCLLAIKQKHHAVLEPLVLGGGMNLWVEEHAYQSKKFPLGFEGGTQNYPKILLLISLAKILTKK